MLVALGTLHILLPDTVGQTHVLAEQKTLWIEKRLKSDVTLQAKVNLHCSRHLGECCMACTAVMKLLTIIAML